MSQADESRAVYEVIGLDRLSVCSRLRKFSKIKVLCVCVCWRGASTWLLFNLVAGRG